MVVHICLFVQLLLLSIIYKSFKFIFLYKSPDNHTAERCDQSDQGEDGQAHPQRHPNQHWTREGTALLTSDMHAKMTINGVLLLAAFWTS